MQALADVAIENVQVLNNLQILVNERLAELQAANDRLLREIELRKAAEERAWRQSLTDDLTGLYNRRGFFQLATERFKLAYLAKETSWLLFADADGLKAVNDSAGHLAGDRLLIGVAKALRRSANGDDSVIGRLGGDEFAIYASGPGLTATVLRERLARAIEHVNRSDRLNISLSIGIARCEPGTEVALEDHLRFADNAMYSEKQAKRPGMIARR